MKKFFNIFLKYSSIVFIHVAFAVTLYALLYLFPRWLYSINPILFIIYGISLVGHVVNSYIQHMRKVNLLKRITNLDVKSEYDFGNINDLSKNDNDKEEE